MNHDKGNVCGECPVEMNNKTEINKAEVLIEDKHKLKFG